MTSAEEKYKDIIHHSWPADPALFRKHPRMPLEERAKIFAPFAALRGHSDRLAEESGKLFRTGRISLSEEEAAVLSGRLSQVKCGGTVTVTYFIPDTSDGDVGFYIPLTGRVAALDPVFRTIRILTDEPSEKGESAKTIRFDDLIDIVGKDITDTDFAAGDIADTDFAAGD